MFKHFPRVPAPRATALLLASVSASAFGLAAPVHAQTVGYSDYLNEWDVPYLDPQTNTVGPDGMEFDFLGDATTCIPPQVNADPRTNPFYAYQQYGGPLANPDTITYDAGANITRVVLSGAALPVPPPLDQWNGGTFQGPTYGNGNGILSYHVGLVTGIPGACTTAHPFLKKLWLWNAGGGQQQANIPVIGTNFSGLMTRKNIDTALSAVLYLETRKPLSNGTWSEISYVPNKKGKPTIFILKNNGTVPITLGSAGLVTGLPQPTDPLCQTNPSCPEIQANLDLLNDQYFPVPGQPNSPFTPLPKLNGLTVKPGKSIKITMP
jgi:hypothetical protein